MIAGHRYCPPVYGNAELPTTTRDCANTQGSGKQQPNTQDLPATRSYAGSQPRDAGFFFSTAESGHTDKTIGLLSDPITIVCAATTPHPAHRRFLPSDECISTRP